VAFEVFNSNELEGLLANQYEHIKGLDGGEVFERRTHRTRFKKLQETLKGLSEIDALQAFGELGVKLDKEAPEGGVEDDSTLLAKTPDEALEEEVRKRTDSRRALLITNRPDTDLANALETRLGFSKVEVKLSNPRQVASTSESIANGHWDFVLMASGFLSHSVDGVIFDACRRAGVRAIRVNKGRPGIVVRTLGRVLVYGQDG
jgi:hypothetical protein